MIENPITRRRCVVVIIVSIVDSWNSSVLVYGVAADVQSLSMRLDSSSKASCVVDLYKCDVDVTQGL